MAYVVGLLVLLVGLVASIALHELGHMIPAKRFGVRVSRYMVGFGPTLWSRTRGETEYGIKAIPLGGYVRLVGMLPSAEAVGARPGAGRMGEMVQDARAASADEIRPGEEHRAFYQLSAPKKVVVMLGGPVMNLVIAAVLLAVVLVGIGLPGAATTTVGMTLPCVLPVDAPADRVCTSADQPTPSAAAGLQVGDVLLSYGGFPIGTWEDFLAAVREVDGGAIPLVVDRAGEQITLSVSPIVTERPVFDEQNRPVLGENGEIVTEPARYIGLSPTSTMERQPVSQVVPVVGTAVWETTKAMVALPVKLFDIAKAMAVGGERDPSVMGLVGVGRAAGEIAATDAPGGGLAERAVPMLLLIASLNIALFVFNLIPLLPLDGGHVAGALWEGAKRQRARLRGLPRPAPADMARMMPLAYGMFLVLTAMGVFLIVADIVRPVTF